MSEYAGGEGLANDFARSVDDDVLDDGAAHGLSEEGLVVAVGIGGEPQDAVSLAVEVAAVVLAVLANGRPCLVLHVNVGGEQRVEVALAGVHLVGEPVQLVAVADEVVALCVLWHEVVLHDAADGAEAAHEVVLVAHGTLGVRVGHGRALLGVTGAVERAVGIDLGVRGVAGGVCVLRVAQVLAPGAGVGIAVEQECQAARGHVAVADDGGTLVCCGVEEALGGDAGAVAPERVVAVAAAENLTGVPEALHLHAAVSAEPSGDDGALAAGLDVAGVVAVGDTGGGAAVHHHTEDGAAVVAAALHVAFVAYVLQRHPSAAVAAAYDAAHHRRAGNLVASSCHEVLHHAAAVHHAEDAYLVGAGADEVVDDVVLSVEGSHVAVVVVADGRPRLARHVDVGSEHGIGVVLAPVDDGCKSRQVVGRANLIGAVLLVQGPGTAAPCQGADQCQHRCHSSFHNAIMF